MCTPEKDHETAMGGEQEDCLIGAARCRDSTGLLAKLFGEMYAVEMRTGLAIFYSSLLCLCEKHART